MGERPQDARFRFCPHDATPLELRPQPDGERFPTCPVCKYTDYHNPKPCVAVLITRDGRLLLARRGVPPAEGWWDIPGGFLEADETAEAAAVREVKQETGLDVRITRYLCSLPDVYEHGGRADATLNLGFAAEAYPGEPKPASDVRELAWFRPDELPTAWPFAHQQELIRIWKRDLAD